MPRKRKNGYKGPLSKLRATERREIRASIYARDKYTCWLCLESVDISLKDGDPFAPTLDHVVPHMNGGKDHPKNLKLAHAKCNNDRHKSVNRDSLKGESQKENLLH